jgi:tetratricopeptide (TPR) repeat protein
MPETIYGKIRISTHAESSRKGFPDSLNAECMEHYQRGVDLGRENRLEEAVEEMVLALEADPTYLWARVNAGAYLYLLGGDKLDLAEKVLKEAIREAQRGGFEGIAEVAAVNLMALNIDKFRLSGSEKVELLAKTYSFVEKLLKRPQEPMFVLHAAVMLLMLGRQAEARGLIFKAKRLKGYENTAKHLKAEYSVLQGVA